MLSYYRVITAVIYTLHTKKHNFMKKNIKFNIIEVDKYHVNRS